MLPLIVFFALASPLNNLNKVGEAEFSVMLLDIWLSSDTSAPKLRRGLLGRD